MENINNSTFCVPSQKRLSKSGELRINSFFEEFKDYVLSRYNDLEGVANYTFGKFGALFRFLSEDLDIEVKVWQYSNSYLNLPDDIIIVSEFDTDNSEWENTEKAELYHFLIVYGLKFGFCHIATENMIENSVKQEFAIEGTAIPCYRLYNVSPSNPNNEQ